MRILFYESNNTMRLLQSEDIGYSEDIYNVLGNPELQKQLDEQGDDLEVEITEGLEFYTSNDFLYVIPMEKTMAEAVMREVLAKDYVNLCKYEFNGNLQKLNAKRYDAETGEYI